MLRAIAAVAVIAALMACGNTEHVAKLCFYIDANSDPTLSKEFDYGRAVVPLFNEFASEQRLSSAGELSGGLQSFTSLDQGIHISLTFGIGGQRALAALFTDQAESSAIFSEFESFLVAVLGSQYDVYPCSDVPGSELPVLTGVRLRAT